MSITSRKFIKLTTIIAILLFVMNNSIAAEKRKSSIKQNEAEKEKPVDMDYALAMLKATMSIKSKWSLAFEYSHKDYTPKGHLATDIQLLQSAMDTKEDKKLTPYVETLHNLLLALDTLGKDKAYFLVEKDEIPFSIINYNGKKSIMIYSLGVPSVYNTFKLTAKERASKVILSNIIPALKNIDKILNKSDFKYYMLFLTFGSKDFTKSDDQDNLKAETIQMIIAKSECRKFVDNQLTDQELVDKSIILLSDRDNDDFMRIKVNLQ